MFNWHLAKMLKQFNGEKIDSSTNNAITYIEKQNEIGFLPHTICKN